MSDTALPSATKLSKSSHGAVPGAFDRSPNAEPCGTFIGLYLAVGRPPRTGPNRDKPWFRCFGLRTNLTDRKIGVYESDHVSTARHLKDRDAGQNKERADRHIL